MIIRRLDIEGVRNLSVKNLVLSPRFNLIHGENASGKTSILEAINILLTGKSFRTRHFKKYIQNNQNESLVTAELEPIEEVVPDDIGKEVYPDITHANHRYKPRLCVQRFRDGSSKVSFSQAEADSFSSVAKLIPLIVLAPDLPVLLDMSLSSRRQYLDWSVFHVKHDFHAAWKRYNFALKNRNKLIKISPIQHLELDYWDEMLSVEGERLSLMRQAVFSELIQSVQYLVEAFSEFSISEKSFNLHFNPGWDQVNWHLKGKTFQDYLISRRARDHKLGYTLCGPHKSEVVFRFNGEAAQDKLSRGQRKWLSFCLKCAQVKHLSDQYNKRCLILIDDFSSELDKGRQTRFLELLSALKAQVILTSIYKEDISFESNTLNSLLDTLEMFHVEHGKVA